MRTWKVYIEQLEGFPLTEEKDMVCKLKKALYGLKQVPITWYARLDKSLAKIGFDKGTIDGNLYLKKIEDGLLIIIVFVDDIIFGWNDEASNTFLEDMKNEFEMSMVGEKKFSLGLQIVQNKGVFISQTKYLKDFLKRFGLENCKPIGTPMVVRHKLSRKDKMPNIK